MPAETIVPPPSFPTAVVMLALDDRDPWVVDAVVAAHQRLGLRQVLVVHVVAEDDRPLELSAGLSAAPVLRPLGFDAAVEQLVGRLGPVAQVRAELRVGTAPDVLSALIQAHDVDLLVMGRDAAVDGGVGWGPAGRDLLRAARCSVLVVPQGARWEGLRAVTGLDFSSCSSMALQVAVHLADAVEAVTQYAPDGGHDGAPTADDFADHLTENARRHFEDVVLPELVGGVRPTLAVRAGDSAADLLLAHAGDDLLVVGSRGLSALATVLLGSTAETLAGRAAGPVLVVRRKGEVLGVVEGLFHR